ncbi:hypothetical protein GH714_018742 [Hevea brasiliensis]|uniref:CCHC-type domain-containing protein n=1 Tax=Hevea brasiliensis TaxID=3981 RepID=A0A6A6MEZ2_HEVBR|nr:hypothetical protein GH714_018742 [Hevea brasiliensis]
MYTSKSSMASSSSFSCSPLSHDYERPDLESIKALLIAVNEYFLEFLANAELWNSLKSQCISKLNIRKQEFFEFYEHSVLSNLYWGIENIEAAIHAKCTEEKTTWLMNSERMLQAPALLDEHGVTAGIQNHTWSCYMEQLLSGIAEAEGVRPIKASHCVFGQEIASIWSSTIYSYDTAEKPKTCTEIRELQDDNKAFNQLDQVPKLKIQTEKYKSIKCLKEVLLESQSDTPTSANSSYSYYLEKMMERMPQASCFTLDQLCTMMNFPPASQQKVQEVDQVNISSFSSGRFPDSISCFDLSILELRNKKSGALQDRNVEDNSAQRTSWKHNAQVTNQVATAALQSCRLMQRDDQKKVKDKKEYSHCQNNLNELCHQSGKDSNSELMVILEKIISRLCFSEGLAKCEEDYAVKVTAVYKMLDSKKEIKYTILKDFILDQLLTAISTSKEENVTRASISILTSIVSINKSAIEDIKNKGLRLCDLATALKQNMHEAAILIYFINPPPEEIKTLELLPELMEIVCTSNSYKGKPASELLTPPAASLMIIEILVTAFDCDTNNMQLAAISSPHILSRLPDVARDNNLEECISMAKIFIKCMQFDGQCRKQYHNLLLWLHLNVYYKVMRSVPSSQPFNFSMKSFACQDIEYMQGHSSGKSMFMEEAMQIILKSVASEENSTLQQISTFILANIGGTYSWTGEPYTVALLVKKAGVTSLYHRNMIRNFNWSLQDAGMDSWCSKIAKGIISIGKPVFHALEKGIRRAALEERLLACLCIYNYTSGRDQRISCVHTQILEAKQSKSGAVTALIYYRGLLYSGYSDGSIKVWYIKQQSATLVWDLKEHKKAVTCFSLFEPGESLLSGSADKTIRVWQMVHRKLECIEVIAMKEPIQKIETYGQMIFMITQSHRMKVFDSSRIVREMSKTKRAKCMCAVQGKLYIGCMDSSIQVHGLSLNQMTRQNAKQIASIFGGLLESDFAEDCDVSIGACLRIKVNIDVTKPLIESFTNKKASKMERVQFRYERLLDVCYMCGLFGHQIQSCPNVAKVTSPENQGRRQEYGPWMRAEIWVSKSRKSATKEALASHPDDQTHQPNEEVGMVAHFPQLPQIVTQTQMGVDTSDTNVPSIAGMSQGVEPHNCAAISCDANIQSQYQSCHYEPSTTQQLLTITRTKTRELVLSSINSPTNLDEPPSDTHPDPHVGQETGSLKRKLYPYAFQ